MGEARELCHVCGRNGLREFPDFALLPQVTSDCRAWPAGGRLAVCRGCATVQHLVNDQWRHGVAQIYDRYEVYYQGGGAEQQTFSVDGAAAPRSARLVRFLEETRVLGDGGRLLDYGCGNGAFLHAFAPRPGGWALFGADIGERHRRAVEAIGGVERYINLLDTPDPGSGFDLITMSHCLEHLENPAPLLNRMQEWLAPDGGLLIQIPHLLESPFDLVVADHCSHFTAATLHELLDAAGYDVIHMKTTVVPKEITALARPAVGAPRRASSSPPDVAATLTFVAQAVRWLHAVMAERERISSSGPLGIFGTSIAGIWLYGGAPGQVAFFVDEDPNRVGGYIGAIPVLHPSEVDEGASVLLAMPRPLADRLHARLGAGPGCYHLPPSWPTN